MRHWSVMEPCRAALEEEETSGCRGVEVASGGDWAGCLSLEWEVGASTPTGAIGNKVSS